MENGDSFFAQDANSSSGSQKNSSANKGNPTPINSNNNGVVPHLAVRDKSNMPITSVTKIMRRALPSNAKISESAKEKMQQCVSRYINLITTKAKERCQKEYRKIMTTEDLLWAMKELRFDDYIGPLTAFIQHNRRNEGELFTHNVKSIPDTNGPSPEPVGMLQTTCVKHISENSGPKSGPVIPTVEMLQPNFVKPIPNNNGPGAGLFVPTTGMLQPNFVSIPDNNGLEPVVPTAGMFQSNFVKPIPDNNGPGPIVPTAGMFQSNFVKPIPDNNGPVPGPVMPTVGMLQPTLPPPSPPVASFGSDFFMDPNINLGVFCPMDLDDFLGQELGVGGSNNAMNNFDPCAEFNYDHM